MNKRSEGQILVLFALVIVALLGISALVIDIGFKYSVERRYQAIADGASLAGAQDLQPDSRTSPPTSADYEQARKDALHIVLAELRTGPPSDCPTDVDLVDCALPGGQFTVSIRTPSPNCDDCVPARSVQVTVREPEHPVTLARIFGQDTWDVSRTSVAGESFGKAYALITLRPPKWAGQSGNDQNVDDINLAGTNTVVNVLSGDVGTNTYVVTNSMSRINLDPGYTIYHYDVGPTPDSWNNGSGDPPGQKTGLVPLPQGYDYQSVYDTMSTVSTTLPQADCITATAGLTFFLKTGDTRSASDGTLICQTPGVYLSKFTVSNGTAVYLMPGVHKFTNGLDVNDYLYGGLNTGEGVAVVISGGSFTGGNAKAIDLNPVAGPAVVGGISIASPDGLPISLVVPTYYACFSGDTVLLAGACVSSPDPTTTAIKLDGSTGGANSGPWINISGVIWAPTDNAVIGSNFIEQASSLGRIITWSVKYSGGAALNLVGLAQDGPGTVRIDTACSPGEPQDNCN